MVLEGVVFRHLRVIPIGGKGSVDGVVGIPTVEVTQGGRETGKQFGTDGDDLVAIPDPDTLLDVDAVLNRLAREDPAAADVARLRLLAGLIVDEAVLAKPHQIHFLRRSHILTS